MGYARRMVRRSGRRAVRRTVRTPARRAVRTVTPRPVRQATHPVRTVRIAATPRPVRQVARATWTVRHPVRAGESNLLWALHRLFWLPFIAPRRRRELTSPAVQAGRPQAAPSQLARQPRLQAAGVALPVQIGRWLEGPGGACQAAVADDLRALASFLRQAASDRTSESLVEVQNACGGLAFDVRAALAGPPIPDEESQRWWTKALAELQQTAADTESGAATRNWEAVSSGSSRLQAATASMNQAARRLRAIREASGGSAGRSPLA